MKYSAIAALVTLKSAALRVLVADFVVTSRGSRSILSDQVEKNRTKDELKMNKAHFSSPNIT